MQQLSWTAISRCCLGASMPGSWRSCSSRCYWHIDRLLQQQEERQPLLLRSSRRRNSSIDDCRLKQ
jgi:hypothetical protein